MDFDSTTISLPNAPVPLFPLPGVFLFPHQVLPLHIFEERYRTMVKDLLDGPGRLVIAAPVLGQSAAPGQTPEVLPVAGFGEILRHEKLDDGRYMIWVLGVSRVHIQEVPCETPYRQVEVLPFLETAVPEPQAEDLSRELRDAAAARLKEPLPLPDSTPPGLLADLLMQTLQASRDLIERAFIEPDVTARAQLALREAERKGALDEDDPQVTVQIDRDDNSGSAASLDMLDELLAASEEGSPQFPEDSTEQGSDRDERDAGNGDSDADERDDENNDENDRPSSS